MKHQLTLLIPPIRKLDAGSVYNAMPLMETLLWFGFPEGAGESFIIYSDGVIAIKWAALAVNGAGKIGEFCNGATGVWR